MKEMVTYLNFDGNARDAMQFYARCLQGELLLMPFSEANVDAPPEAQDRTMHAKLTKGSCVLMASDIMPGIPFQRGNNFYICLNCESLEETERYLPRWERKARSPCHCKTRSGERALA